MGKFTDEQLAMGVDKAAKASGLHCKPTTESHSREKPANGVRVPLAASTVHVP